MEAPLGERLAAVRHRIEDAAARAGRDPATITTIVVTKFHPAQLIRDLHALGVRDFGESRHQEAQPKIAELADLGATWHFVGQVQGKKAKQVRSYADVVHSVDRESLADGLDGTDGADGSDRRLDVFIQLNLTDDPARGGVHPDGVAALAEHVLAKPGLRLLGLMAVAPLGVEPRGAFEAVRGMSERLLTIAPAASALSMGMSGDFEDAILEGATHLRIGTAITGNRPIQG